MKYTCFSRDGSPISYLKWSKLIVSPNYTRLLKDSFHWFRVTTNWFGMAVSHKGKNYIFKTEVYCSKCPFTNNALDGEIYDTDANAWAGHAMMVEKWFHWGILIKHVWNSHILGKMKYVNITPNAISIPENNKKEKVKKTITSRKKNTHHKTKKKKVSFSQT